MVKERLLNQDSHYPESFIKKPDDTIFQKTDNDENKFENFEKIAPHLNWKNSAIVPWAECVRDSEKQPNPTTDIQNIYYENNKDFRLHFLNMISDIVTEKVNNLESFRERFANLHKILITGENGENIYMKPDQKTKIGSKSAHDIAGNYGKNIDDWNAKLEDLLLRLQNFLKAENFYNHTQLELTKQVGEIFFENLNGFPQQFSYGYNSFNMNITNGLLRLIDLNGIPHENLDINFMCRMNREKFPKTFMNCVNKANKNSIRNE